MIKAGIIGGSNPMAGELIRLLINHPDVEIMWVDSARFTGRLVSDVHHGLTGETSLRITPSSSNILDDINVLFIFRHKGQTIEWLDENQLPENIRIVDLSVDMREPENAEKYQFVYGMPELNRKPMVRGAKRAVLPHPVANIIELALMPLAKAGAISAPASATVSVPEKSEQVDDADALVAEIAHALQSLQPELPEISLRTSLADNDRAMQAVIKLQSPIDIGEILLMYEEAFDDHNFTFLTNTEPDAKEVEGTNKCMIHIDKADDIVTVTAVYDAMIKGAAGTAVHDMNLLFGLHERVGLALKASTF